MVDERNQHFNSAGFDDDQEETQQDFRSDPDMELDLDEFDDESLPYATNYAEPPQTGLWAPMLAAALLILALAMGYAWYSLHTDLAGIEKRLSKIPELPPGLAEHQHPKSLEMERMEIQLELLSAELQVQRELLEIYRQPADTAQAVATAPASPTPAEPPPAKAAADDKPAATKQEAPALTQAPAAAEPSTSPAAPVETPRPVGKWVINLGSFKQESSAQVWADTLSADSYPIEVSGTRKAGTTLYRVRVTGLPNKTEARRIVGMMQDEHKLKGLWISAP
jgi:cell division septation protein DedD